MLELNKKVVMNIKLFLLGLYFKIPFVNKK